ncbi:MAG: hypothetical protein M3282_02035 [Gemmatimonadota bacterium]|nr:hypothetical protein [Gemmatimonadota bacterium]
MKRALCATALAAMAVLIGAVACDNVSGPQSERVSLALSVPRPAAFGAGEVTLSGSDDEGPVIIVRGRQQLRLDLVELRLARIELRGRDLVNDEDTDLDTDTDNDTDTDSDTDTDGGNRNTIQFRGPVEVAVPLRGDVIVPFATLVPVGTYNRVRLWVDRVHLVGAFDDDMDGEFEETERFNVTVPVRQHITLRIDPPLVVRDGDAANVTIELRPPDWFRNADRSLFNPRRLNNDNQLRARFRHLVRATLRALEDANRNGDNDRDTDSDR